jgi:DNA invertase Pin-like site-specific DNA recombinase
MAAAEFERELIRERSMAGLKRYRGQYAAGKVGKEVHSRSGKDLPVGRPRGRFDRQQVVDLRAGGNSYRQIARQIGIGDGTVRRVLGALTYMEGR